MNGTPSGNTASQLAAKIRANVVGLRHTTASVRDGAAYNRYIDNLLDTADTLDPPQYTPANQIVEGVDASSGESRASASVLEMAHRFPKSASNGTPPPLHSDSTRSPDDYHTDNLKLESIRRMDESGVERCLGDSARTDPSFGE